MKKIIITASTLLILGGGISYAANASPDTTPKIDDYNETIQNEVTYTNESLEVNDHQGYESYEEYNTLADIVGGNVSDIEVVKDNGNKRTILIMGDHGEPQYKSIYVKKKNRLKVIDFDGGLVFNEVLGNTSQTPDDKIEAPQTESEEMAEYATINNYVNVSDYTTNVVEDNQYKRVIVLKDNNNQPQYKSIYVKNKGQLKIIDLDGGLVYNGIIQ